MWNGGKVPYGFVRAAEGGLVLPDREKLQVVESMFKMYVKTRSDFLNGFNLNMISSSSLLVLCPE